VNSDNDHTSMSQPLDERATDALLAGRSVPGEEALTAFVADTLALTRQPAPAPTAALAELLENGLVPDSTLRPTLPKASRHWWLLPVPLAVGSLLVAGGIFGAAGANALPAPAQRVVSDTVATLTPIHLPKPASKPKPTITPAPSEDPVEPSDVNEPPESTEPAESAEPSERPEPTDGQRDRRDDSPSRAPSAATNPPADDRHDDSGDSDGHDGSDRAHDRAGGPGGDERG
jgi:hypothetical protein